jgi:hypothetical protein
MVGHSATIDISTCAFPALSPRYDKALREAVQYILARHSPLGIFACGSIVRGTPDRSSDLDLYVIITGNKRQRIQRFFNRVPAEIFVNPPRAVRGYFENEAEAGRQLTAHMLATGHLLLCRDNRVLTLRREAQRLLANPRPLSTEGKQFLRYICACSVEDATDLIKRDPLSAVLIGNRALHEMLYYFFQSTQKAIPRDKELVTRLATANPPLARAVRSYLREESPLKKIQYLRRCSRLVLKTTGFFAWETKMMRL